MNKMLCSAAAVVLLLGVMGGSAFAQRTASDKFLGHFGHGFWGTYPRSGGGSYYYTPTYTPASSYRSFSYQPINVRAGDKVQVAVNSARLMDAQTQVGTLPKGQEFEVQKVTNGWLRATVKQNGKTLNGWVWHSNVNVEQPVAPPVQAN